MKKWTKRFFKFIVAPLLVLALIAVLSFFGYRAQLQSKVSKAIRIDTPNGIQVLEPIEIGGVDQWIQIRGHDHSNPVLLFLHGGPGSPMTPLSHAFQLEWEKHFTVVQWDQRESGKSYQGDATAETMTVEQALEDTMEMVDYLRKRFDQDKIVLLGHSWGSYLGVQAIQRESDWFHAYVGVGQVVNMQENERVTYEYTLEQAKARDHTIALAELEALAPYPSDEDFVEKLLTQRKWLLEFGGSVYGETSYDSVTDLIFESPDYGILDIYRFLAGMEFVMGFLLDPLLSADISSFGTDYQVPIFIFSGRHDFQVLSNINHAWFETITAPHKEYVWFEESCHSPMLDETERFAEELISRVLPFARNEDPDAVAPISE